MPHQTREEVVLLHLDAAFNFAQWFAKNDADAKDVVQDDQLGEFERALQR